MKTAIPANAPKLKTPRKPEDCFDWLTEDQVVEMARRAFRLTCVATFPPEGETFIWDLPGAPLRSRVWSGREDFEESLWGNFQGVLRVHADAVGLKGYADLAHRHQSYEQAIGFASSYPDASITHGGPVMSALTDRIYAQWRQQNGSTAAQRVGRAEGYPTHQAKLPGRVRRAFEAGAASQGGRFAAGVVVLPPIPPRPVKPKSLQTGNYVPEMCIALAVLCTSALFMGL